MYRFFKTCVDWPEEDVYREGGLTDMILGAIDLTRRTFLRHVDREELKNIARTLGYEEHPKRGLTMAADWAISYHRSKLHGQRVYFFKWSGIEHVFTFEEESHA